MSKIHDLTLLYVEDDDDLREQFVRILKNKFRSIIEASNGIEALEMYRKHKPDMMLVDINIPKIDGLEVIKMIRVNDEEMPIAILSAYSDQDKLLTAIKCGLSDYLIKPVPYKKLLNLLNDMVDKSIKCKHKNSVVLLQNGYIWNKAGRTLLYEKESIALTKRERIFLEYMVGQLDKVVTFDDIANLLWEEEESYVAYSSLSHLLKRLRKKLPEGLIENIYAEGYRIPSI